VGPDIKAGRLMVVLPDYPPTELGIFAVYAPNRYLAAKTRLMIDFLASRFGDRPRWDDFLTTKADLKF
jgi:DNA-binding transcriptional LysR family regulator